jgi:hypothetical protein
MSIKITLPKTAGVLAKKIKHSCADKNGFSRTRTRGDEARNAKYLYNPPFGAISN